MYCFNSQINYKSCFIYYFQLQKGLNLLIVVYVFFLFGAKMSFNIFCIPIPNYLQLQGLKKNIWVVFKMNLKNYIEYY